MMQDLEDKSVGRLEAGVDGRARVELARGIDGGVQEVRKQEIPGLVSVLPVPRLWEGS